MNPENPSDSSSSLRPSHPEPLTSRKRLASSDSSDLVDSPPDSRLEWQRSSIAWKESYDQKVASCLLHNQLPVGPVEFYLDLTSSSYKPEEGNPSSQDPNTSVFPQHLSSSVEQENATGVNIIPSIDSVTPPGTTEPSVPQPMPPTQVACLILAPETPGYVSATPPVPTHTVKSQQHSRNFTHSNLPRPYLPPRHDEFISAAESPPALGKDNVIKISEIRPEPSNSSAVEKSNGSPSCSKIQSAKRPRPASKLKPTETLDEYDRLSSREKSSRFPSVAIWATFLSEAISSTSRRIKVKQFMKRCHIYYLVDPQTQPKLDDADRMRMRRLAEAGAQLKVELKAKHVTHIVVREGTTWSSCLRAIKNLVPDRLEREIITGMCLSPPDKIPGEELIWVVSSKWVEACLTHQAIPAERYMRIGPNAAKILTAKKPVQIVDPESKVTNHPAASDSSDQSSYDEIETSFSLEPSVHQVTRKVHPVERIVQGLESQLELARLGEGAESDESEANQSGKGSQSSSSTGEGTHLPRSAGQRAKNVGRYACDRPTAGVPKKNGPNEDICQKLEKIIELYGVNPNDQFRILAIRKALNVLRTQTKRSFRLLRFLSPASQPQTHR